MTDVITSQDIAEHIVNRGAALLDQYTPDWFTRINVDTLAIASASRCVLAQSLGKIDIAESPFDHDYMHGLSRLRAILCDSGIETEWDFERNHGFMSTWIRRDSRALEGLDVSAIVFDSDGEIWLTGTLLTDAWKDAVIERQSVAV